MSKDLPKTPCQIPELNLSCYGCCGNDFTNFDSVNKDIKRNTIELNQIIKDCAPSSQKEQDEALISFRDRYGKNILGSSGVCLNLTKFKSGCFACPLHKDINSLVPKSETKAPSSDIRLKPCDVNYECITFKRWKTLSSSQKEQYIKFLEKRVIGENHFSYSMKNHDGIFLEEFFKKN